MKSNINPAPSSHPASLIIVENTVWRFDFIERSNIKGDLPTTTIKLLIDRSEY